MRIATVTRIPIRLHWSFLALVCVYALTTSLTEGLSGLAMGLLTGAALFGSVVLHELGHALAARAFGIPTESITLFPFGGIAAIHHMPARPAQEALISLAGPTVNFALAALITPVAILLGSWGLAVLVGVNVIMGAFNLVPAFPMDGGRVLRALLATRLGYVRASLLAMTIGQVFAAVFLVIGFVSWTPSLVLVGGFLLFAIATERRRMRTRLAQGWQPIAAWRTQAARP